MKNYDDFEKLTCTTKIKDVRDGYYTFDDTVFYGEKGGQLADRGTINGQPVTDLKWDGDTLYHQVKGELHDPITMKVDARTRWINTTVQSAFHLLDGYYAGTATRIVEVNADPENEWYIVDSKQVDAAQLRAVEDWMNDVIHQDIPTRFTYVKGDAYPDPAYRKYPLVRLVHFGDINTQPCGTCHVNHTGQLQSFAILGTEKVSAGTKIYITVNLATNDRLKKDEASLKQAATVLSTTADQVVSQATALVAKNKTLKQQFKALKKEVLGMKAKGILAADQVVNRVQLDAPGDMSQLAPQLLRQVDHDKLLVAQVAGRTSFAVVSPSGQARAVLARFQKLGTVNGGGSPQIVTGNTDLAITDLVDAARPLLKA
ncbi:hypothetical protein [Limosilactobacillus sp.]|uniref:hypothetical protein n=1 Tax=Limosilactobacillus sp. TaxID=2773925 RepID=UPI003F0A5EB5